MNIRTFGGGVVLCMSLFLFTTPVFAATDGSPCTTPGQTTMGADGFLLVCNNGVSVQGVMQYWYESCGFSPMPAGCPGTPTQQTSQTTNTAGSGAAPSSTTGYCRSGKDAIVDVPWPGAYGQVRPLTNGFGLSTVSFRLRIPANVPDPILRKSITDFQNVGFVRIAEKPGSRVTDRMLSVSKSPCDFNHTPIVMRAGDTAPSITFGISRDLPYSGGGVLNFKPGDVIYINVSHDLSGYGAMPETVPGTTITNRTTCPAGGSCDILFDFAIPGRGIGYPSAYSWPPTTAQLSLPLLACQIAYTVDNLGHAPLSTTNASLYQKADGTTQYGSCPGAASIQTIINQQAAPTGGTTPVTTTVTNTTSGAANSPGTITINVGGSTITITPEAALSIIQKLAETAGASSGVTVSPTSNAGAYSFTAGGTTFRANTMTDLAALYANYLKNYQTNTDTQTGGVPNITNTNSARTLTVNLAPGDYNPPEQVMLLQKFLNTELGRAIPITGFFGDQTIIGVIVLQNKYSAETYKKAWLTAATGFVGQYTRDLINSKLKVVSGGVTPPPTVAVQNHCTSSDQIINVPWPSLGGVDAEQSQYRTSGFTQNIMAFKLTIPSSFNPPLKLNQTGYISMVEVPGNVSTARDVSVSRNPCDFTNSAMVNGNGGVAPAWSFAVNNPLGYRDINAWVNFQPGEVYYVNVRNQYRGASTCPVGNRCDILFNYKTPNSY